MSVEVKRALEAIIMVADSPVEAQLLAQFTDTSQEEVEALLAELAAEHRAAGRGFELAQVAGGWRFQSHPDQAAYVERFVLEGQTAKLSAAALETLAIVAYKQPISRAQVAAIRGVSVDGVVRTLEQRGYITEVARDPGPGQAILFGTTPLFLDKLGLNSLSDLPAIADFVPGADVVEALEHGLRVEPADPDTADANGDGSPAAPASAWPGVLDADEPASGPEGDGTTATDADTASDAAGEVEASAEAAGPSTPTSAVTPVPTSDGPAGAGAPGGPDLLGADRPSLDDLLDGDG